jgi:hypothetical protein
MKLAYQKQLPELPPQTRFITACTGMPKGMDRTGMALQMVCWEMHSRSCNNKLPITVFVKTLNMHFKKKGHCISH